MRTGTTLLELITALALLGILLGLAAPPFERARARARVVTAREALVAELGRARAAGVARGSARLVVARAPARAHVLSGGDTLRTVVWSTTRGSVDVDPGAGRDSVVIPFDGLGLGRFANATVTFRSGDAAAVVVVSTYGRVRRR